MKRVTVELEYAAGDSVYLKTDPDQHERIVRDIYIRPGGAIMYEVICDLTVSAHYGFELSDTPDIVKRTSN